MKYSALAILALLSLFPLYWMGITALQPMVGIIAVPPNLFPKVITFDNFTALLSGTPWLTWAGNTVLITACTVLLSVLVSASAGYAFSVFKFKGKEAIFWVLMMSMMITRYALMIPVFVVMRKLGLYGQMAVILSAVYSPYGIYMFKVFCDGIPRSYIESARLDGAGEWRIMAHVMLPLTAPAVGVLVIAKGMETLQDYVWQALVLTMPEQFTALVGFIRVGYDNIVKSGYMQNYGVEAAAGTLLLLPLLGVFAVASKYFIKGIGEGGEKG